MRTFKCECCEEIETVEKPHSLAHCECGGLMYEIPESEPNKCPKCGEEEMQSETEKRRLIWEQKNRRESSQGGKLR